MILKDIPYSYDSRCFENITTQTIEDDRKHPQYNDKLSIKNKFMNAKEYLNHNSINVDDIKIGDLSQLMEDYHSYKSNPIDFKQINDLPENQKEALDAATCALYFEDNSDYETALYQVVSKILNKVGDIDEDTIKHLYKFLNK